MLILMTKSIGRMIHCIFMQYILYYLILMPMIGFFLCGGI